MARFNKPKASIIGTNEEGHAAYLMEGKERLLTQVLTTFFNEPKFYSDNSSDIVKGAAELAKDDPQFIAKLALYARREFNMRSVSHALTAVLASEPAGKPYIRGMFPAITPRADDPAEILAAYITMFGKPIPNALKKGISDSIKSFDEYELAKYKGEQNALKLRDVLRLCHPKPETDEQSDLFSRVLSGDLKTPYTWETELSSKGSTKEVWEGLIASGKLGYMAMLRNLRNIINAKPLNIGIVYDHISDEGRVLNSKQLPFRFLSAYKELEQLPAATSKAFNALETAINISVSNIPAVKGMSVIAVDVSGSMTAPISRRSKITCAEIGLVLGVALSKVCEESIFLTFDTGLYPQAIASKGGILAQARAIPVNGGGTAMELPFQYLIDNKIPADRIIVISDNQINSQWSNPVQSLADMYRKEMLQPQAWVHAIDLQGYGTQQFHGKYTNIISGWSEKALSFISMAESGIGSLVQAIESYSAH